MSDRDDICGYCRHHVLDEFHLRKGEKVWCCNCEDSRYYTDYTDYTDTCEEFDMRGAE